MRGRGLMLVAGMRAGERRGQAQAEAAQQQQAQQQQLYESQQQAAEAQKQAAAAQQQLQAQQAAAPPAAAAPAGGGSDVTAQLQKLADLHQQGILSDQEFASAKQKLLGG